MACAGGRDPSGKPRVLTRLHDVGELVERFAEPGEFGEDGSGGGTGASL